MPSLVSTSSRIWFECGLPRDLMTVSARLRSPFCTVNDTWIQVSAMLEICAFVLSW